MVGAEPARLVVIMVVCWFVLVENDGLLFVVEVVFVQVFAVDCFAFEPLGNICLFDLLVDDEVVEVFGAAVTTLPLLLVIRLALFIA